jgi:uncharacterized protein (TIGR03083 family)
MEIAEHISAIERDGALLAAAAERAGLDAAVPSCPAWRVRDLLRHQGYVHRWAAAYVANRYTEWVPRLTEAEVLAAGPDDAGLVDWFAAGHAALVETLQAADPDVRCWTFLPAPSPLAFWARRQAHETAIHRVDAEQAAGQVTRFPPEFAADGIDELIMGFFDRAAPGTIPESFTLGVSAADVNENWVVGKAASIPLGGVAGTDCNVAGPASALYLLLWNRVTAADGGVAVSGDPDVLGSWQANMQVRWS